MSREFQTVRSRLRSLGSVLALGFFIVVPRLTEACSVCSAGREDETRTAFIVTTAGMTALPFVLVGGMVWYVRRRFIEAEKRSAGSDSAP